MTVDSRVEGCEWEGRWNHVQKLLLRSGPLAHPEFEPGPQVKSNMEFLHFIMA